MKLRKPKLNKHIKTYDNEKLKQTKRLKHKRKIKEKRKFKTNISNKNSSSLIFDCSPLSKLFTINKKSD